MCSRGRLLRVLKDCWGGCFASFFPFSRPEESNLESPVLIRKGKTRDLSKCPNSAFFGGCPPCIPILFFRVYAFWHVLVCVYEFGEADKKSFAHLARQPCHERHLTPLTRPRFCAVFLESQKGLVTFLCHSHSVRCPTYPTDRTSIWCRFFGIPKRPAFGHISR